MCEKCDDIDAKIIRYKRLASQINDKILNDGIAQLIEKVLAEKPRFTPNRTRSKSASFWRPLSFVDLIHVACWRRVQPIAATHSANFSAGV